MNVQISPHCVQHTYPLHILRLNLLHVLNGGICILRIWNWLQAIPGIAISHRPSPSSAVRWRYVMYICEYERKHTKAVANQQWASYGSYCECTRRILLHRFFFVSTLARSLFLSLVSVCVFERIFEHGYILVMLQHYIYIYGFT